MGYDEWQQLAAIVLATSPLPPLNLPGNVRAFRESGELILEAYRLP
jgi:hypothetical protein